MSRALGEGAYTLYARYMRTKAQSTAEILQLEQDNDVFLASASKRDQYRYVLDTETGDFAEANDSAVSHDGHCFFSGKFIELTDQHTDAVHVWRDKSEVHSVSVLDQRADKANKVSHNAVRLMPAPDYKMISVDGQEQQVQQLDPLSCGLLQDVTVQDCDIRAENAALRGVFSDRGICRNLKVTGNTIELKGAEAIALSGVLDGCEFRDNTLRRVAGGGKPTITLYPAKIGSNMADDGELNILSFKVGSGLQYGHYIDTGNRLYDGGETTVLKVQDLRHVVHPKLVGVGAGLTNFDYQTYRMQFTGWKVRDFQVRDPVGYTSLRDWLELREEEYRSGVRVDKRLSPPSLEQRQLGAGTIIDQLAQARKAIEQNKAEFRAMRLADLPHLPMRSFMMKRIAVRNAEVAPLLDLGEADNARRRANLEFVLPRGMLNNLRPGAELEHAVVEKSIVAEALVEVD